jgi:hypothetical protein
MLAILSLPASVSLPASCLSPPRGDLPNGQQQDGPAMIPRVQEVCVKLDTHVHTVCSGRSTLRPLDRLLLESYNRVESRPAARSRFQAAPSTAAAVRGRLMRSAILTDNELDTTAGVTAVRGADLCRAPSLGTRPGIVAR